MKTFILIIGLSLVVSMMSANADTIIDPLKAFAKLGKLSSGQAVYRWDVDLNNDGRKEVLLELKPTPDEIDEEERENGGNPQTDTEHAFTVYLPTKGGYIQSKGVEENGGLALVSMSVDLARCYVGKIAQLNKWGVVTVDLEPAGRKSTASSTVYAYTLEGDHLRMTTLAQYDPTIKGGNAIYDQYLSDSHRTPIKLQEISLP